MKDEIVQAQPPGEEGPRSFVHFLSQLAQGEAEANASYELHELLKRLHEEAHIRNREVKGKFKLALTFAADENGTVTVSYDVEAKAPPRKTSASIFWLSRGSNLVAENPKQQSLPLRDVSARREIRNVEAPAAPAREV